jgi:iron complex outermembrane receptor protein
LEIWRGGFRVDSRFSARDTFTWQEDAYRGTFGQQSTLPSFPAAYVSNEVADVGGEDLLGRWTRSYSSRSDISLQGYLDTNHQSQLLLGQRVTTFDLQFQQHHPFGSRQDLVWGAGYRRVADQLRNSAAAVFTPAQESSNLFSGFVEDEITLLPERVHLTAGSKFEHNDYTGPEVQPTVRLAWAVTPRHHLWAAVSGAVRTPSPSDREVRVNLVSTVLPDGAPLLVGFVGNPRLNSEKLWAYEAGYRWLTRSRFSFDLATFLNHYRQLETTEQGPPHFETSPPPLHIFVPIMASNAGHGTEVGTEASMKLALTDFWRLSASYTWLQPKLENSVSVSTGGPQQFTYESPRNQFNVRSSFYLPWHLDLDVNTYYTGHLPLQQVAGYVRLDTRVGYSPTENMRFSIGGQNLLEDRHAEYRTVYAVTPTEIRRNLYLQLSWTF